MRFADWLWCTKALLKVACIQAQAKVDQERPVSYTLCAPGNGEVIGDYDADQVN